MNVKDIVLEKIKEQLPVSAPVTEATNLYMDLGLDSLSFMILLREIEEAFSISFDLTEMEECLLVGQLVIIVQNKMKERGND